MSKIVVFRAAIKSLTSSWQHANMSMRIMIKCTKIVVVVVCLFHGNSQLGEQLVSKYRFIALNIPFIVQRFDS